MICEDRASGLTLGRSSRTRSQNSRFDLAHGCVRGNPALWGAKSEPQAYGRSPLYCEVYHKCGCESYRGPQMVRASQKSRFVTLSRTKGLVATRDARCFAALNMTRFRTIEKPWQMVAGARVNKISSGAEGGISVRQRRHPTRRLPHPPVNHATADSICGDHIARGRLERRHSDGEAHAWQSLIFVHCHAVLPKHVAENERPRGIAIPRGPDGAIHENTTHDLREGIELHDSRTTRSPYTMLFTGMS